MKRFESHYWKVVFLLMSCCLLPLKCISQSEYLQSETNASKGSLNVISSSQLDKILEQKKIYDSFNAGYEGYRVQIFFKAGSNSKSVAMENANKFHETYPEYPVYLTFREPYYRLRVGNFHNKFQADECLNKVKQTFTASFVIKEFISNADLPIDFTEEITE